MRRKIYNSLLEWKNKHINTPLMVIGARQIGKTYIINEFCKNEFPNYVYINLFEQPEIVEIFEQRISTEEKFNKMQLFLDKQIDIENTIIFFDEIQESEMLISSLKYFCENERPFKIICAGSLLGVKVNRFKSSFPVGKVRMLNMYPMDFEEFLLAFDCDLLIKEIQKCYAQNQPMDNVLHEKLLSLYRLYLCVGGMPDAIKDIVNVNRNIFDFDSSIISNIITAYLNDMNKYVTNVFESAKIETIYKSIPSQLGNNSNKFQYSKIDTNARSRDYETALNWLVSSSMVYKCTALNSIMVPPKAFENANFFKLYISDVGILTSLLGIKYNEILLDNPFIFKGVITENYVAQQLIINGLDLNYWIDKNRNEVDFILYNNDGIIPVEVKSTDNTTSRSLNSYIKTFRPNYAIRLSTKNFGFENNIKSIPLYAAFCIQK